MITDNTIDDFQVIFNYLENVWYISRCIELEFIRIQTIILLTWKKKSDSMLNITLASHFTMLIKRLRKKENLTKKEVQHFRWSFSALTVYGTCGSKRSQTVWFSWYNWTALSQSIYPISLLSAHLYQPAELETHLQLAKGLFIIERYLSETLCRKISS